MEGGEGAAAAVSPLPPALLQRGVPSVSFLCAAWEWGGLATGGQFRHELRVYVRRSDWETFCHYAVWGPVPRLGESSPSDAIAAAAARARTTDVSGRIVVSPLTLTRTEACSPLNSTSFAVAPTRCASQGVSTPVHFLSGSVRTCCTVWKPLSGTAIPGKSREKRRRQTQRPGAKLVWRITSRHLPSEALRAPLVLAHCFSCRSASRCVLGEGLPGLARAGSPVIRISTPSWIKHRDRSTFIMAAANPPHTHQSTPALAAPTGGVTVTPGRPRVGGRGRHGPHRPRQRLPVGRGSWRRQPRLPPRRGRRRAGARPPPLPPPRPAAPLALARRRVGPGQTPAAVAAAADPPAAPAWTPPPPPPPPLTTGRWWRPPRRGGWPPPSTPPTRPPRRRPTRRR